MRAFTEPLTQLQGYEELEQAVQKTEGVILVSGCIDAVKPHIVYSVHNGSGSRIIVTFHEQKAKELLEEYRFFDENVAYYPAKDILLSLYCFDNQSLSFFSSSKSFSEKRLV